MEFPSPKRRRLSPPQLQADESNSQSILRQSPKRPSHLSPTKASLARFHPHLLPRRSESPARPINRDSPAKQARDSIYGTRAQSVSAMDQTRSSTGATPLLLAPPIRFGSTSRSRRAASVNRTSDVGIPFQAKVAVGSDELAEPPSDSSAVRSSPSRMPIKSKVLARNRRLSSPIKEVPSTKQKIDELARGTMLAKGTGGIEVIQEEEDQAQAGEEEPTFAKYEPPDPEAIAKRREKEALERELGALEKDVELYQRELGLLSDDPDMSDEQRLERLLDLIERPSEKKAKPKQPPLSQSLASFLPFESLRPRVPKLPPSVPEPELPSHAPIDLEDPLPFLTLFTDLRCTSTVTAKAHPKSTSKPSSFLQVHTISVRGPGDIFKATVIMTLDPMEESVYELAVQYLSPWAGHELGTWINGAAEERNVGNLFWAINTYLDLARKRAECWIRCEREFRQHVVGAGKARQGKEESTDDKEQIDSITPLKYSKQELRKYIGRDSISLRSNEVVFRVEWKIEFDWTGAAESRVKGLAAFPQIWYESDERNGLQKVTATFDTLVRERGVFNAISLMVALLFS